MVKLQHIDQSGGRFHRIDQSVRQMSLTEGAVR
jgi:hypothetical protein